jgi:integrase/recombinase XerD
MSSFHDHVADYLKARRALGFKLAYPGLVLSQFASYLEAAGAKTITVELAVEFAGLPKAVTPIHLSHRLGAVRGFARYLKTIEPATEVPPVGTWPTSQVRPAPYIWAEQDITRLLDAANALQPRLKALTLATLFGLLAASGLRVGEALGLAGSDVELGSGLLTVRNAKFGRERYVPLHPSTTEALRHYADQRDALVAGPANRHSFVVSTLLNWHRAGLDIGSRLALLSNYLGHTSIEGTYWYFSAVPELMALALERAHGDLGGLA